MKTYEKPKLIALSICGNEMLCSCAIDATNNGVIDPDLWNTWQNMISLGMNPFGTDEACDTPVVGYCKFTAENVVFSS